MEELYKAIETQTGIPPENQILMTSNGNIVKKDNVQQVVQSTGGVRFIYKKALSNTIERLKLNM